ncbi:MAG TPA: NAD(P)H-hydrate dehydratase [Candidatus Acidoferrales bacterium]|jgi:NAD(P)H-hydrate epimerase|nr:NAD(P)H-hydrate dehydratase [Candidatus Acidoferrales bacterium]
MKALTAAEMRDVDRLTTERHGIPGLMLMENAGTSVAEFVRKKFPHLERRSVVVFCGKGNNGGDGFVVARKLREFGAKPFVYLFAQLEEMRGDAAANRDHWKKSGGEIHVVSDAAGMAAGRSAAQSADIVIDALLGTGTRGPVEGLLREAIEAMNARRPEQTVAAVDIPSGANADTGEVASVAVEADYTVTFTAPKIGTLFGQANQCCGYLLVRDIGSPWSLIEQVGKGNVRWSEPREFAKFTVRRKPTGHKGDYGHALIAAGSVGKGGAAVMASWAALRAGAGLVTVATPEPVLAQVAAHRPEVMTEPLRPTETGSIALSNLEHGYFDALLKGKRVLGMGPGLTTHRETQEFVRAVVKQRNVPIVLDADGLNAFDGRAAEMRDSRGMLTITPHPGEMSRLAGASTAEVQARRMEIAKKAAVDWNCCVILKGHQTITAAPSGAVYVNSTGNPGMGTGGTGDVLTGILSGLTAQYGAENWEQTLAFGVWLHGLAGDLAYADYDEAPLMAEDLILAIPRAYQKFYGEMRRG